MHVNFFKLFLSIEKTTDMLLNKIIFINYIRFK